MTDLHAHQPIPRQLWIQQRCIAVETQFNGRIGRAAFAVRFQPLFVLLALASEGLQAMVPFRSYEAADVAADLLGMLSGLALGAFLSSFRQRL